MKTFVKAGLLLIVVIAAYKGIGLFLESKGITGSGVTTVYKTQNCGDFSIELRQSVSKNVIEGNSYSTSLYYVSAAKDIYIYGLYPTASRNHSFSAMTTAPIRSFTLESDHQEGDFLQKGNDEVFRINIPLSPGKFSKDDFIAIGDCLEKNRTQINGALNSPAVYDFGGYYHELNELIYDDIDIR